MALQDIHSAIKKDFLPQVEAYVSDLLKKVETIINNNNVKLESIDVKRGQTKDFFKANPKRFMMTKMAWDGKDETLYFINSIELSIILAGHIMGMAGPQISEVVHKQKMDGNLTEAYQEVSNQLCGSLNQILISKKSRDIHLTLKQTEFLPDDGSKNGQVDEQDFLLVRMNIRVDQQEVAVSYLLIGLELAESIFDTKLSGGSEEEGDAYNFDLKVGQQIDDVSVDKIMITDYPTLPIEKTVGDAYDLMMERKVDALPLIQDGKVVRMISRNNIEIIRSVFFDAPGLEERKARIMCLPLSKINQAQKLLSAQTGDALRSIVSTMSKNQILSVPVISESGEFVGMVTALQLMALIAKST